MIFSSDYIIVLHLIICIHAFGDKRRVTSNFLSTTLDVNPIHIQRYLLQLRTAGLVWIARGNRGIKTMKPLNEITLLDVYRAVEGIRDTEPYSYVKHPILENPLCENLHVVLDPKLMEAQNALEAELQKTTVEDLIRNTEEYIAKK